MRKGTMFNYIDEEGLIAGKLVVLHEIGSLPPNDYRVYICYGDLGKLVIFKSKLPEPEISEQKHGDILPIVNGKVVVYVEDGVYIAKYDPYNAEATKEVLECCLELIKDDPEHLSGLKSANRNIAYFLESLGFEAIAKLCLKINSIEE